MGGKWGRTLSPEVIRRKIIRCLVVKVIHEPAVAERAVCDIGDAQLFGCLDESVCFVKSFKGGILGLDGIDFGDCPLVNECPWKGGLGSG